MVSKKHIEAALSKKVQLKHWKKLAEAYGKAHMWNMCKDFRVDHKVTYKSTAEEMARALNTVRDFAYEDLKVEELQALLVSEGMPRSGNKEDLIVRLLLDKPAPPRPSPRAPAAAAGPRRNSTAKETKIKLEVHLRH